jgi:hypothetical protein
MINYYALNCSRYFSNLICFWFQHEYNSDVLQLFQALELCHTFERFISVLVLHSGAKTWTFTSLYLCLFSDNTPHTFHWLLVTGFMFSLNKLTSLTSSIKFKCVWHFFIFLIAFLKRTIWVTKSRRGTKWVGHVARNGEMRNLCKVLVGKSEGNWLPGRRILKNGMWGCVHYSTGSR